MNKSLSSLDIYNSTTFLLHGAGAPVPVQGERVSGGFFRTLGVRPILGRDFNPDEARLGGPNVALLSYRAWVDRYGARKDIVGQTGGPGQQDQRAGVHDYRRAAADVYVCAERECGVLDADQQRDRA